MPEYTLGVATPHQKMRGFFVVGPLNSPKLIRFHELTEDEYFCTEAGAKVGVTFENTSDSEPLVLLRYFGPEVNKDAPEMGDYRKRKFV